MNHRVSEDDLNVLFRQARTHTEWLDKPVSDDLLRALYDLMKWGPTSANSCPERILFLRTPEAKQRLQPALSPGNVDKTMKAPVTAIIAYDLKFYEQMTKLFPNNPGPAAGFAKAPAVVLESVSFRNGSLQGGYFILAARAVGLDCGPMSGFDNAKVDAEFFPAEDGRQVKSNFLCNLGYGNASKLSPRNPRLDFDEACKLL
jgi:3-hydroxypropanoate dehydrogenase